MHPANPGRIDIRVRLECRDDQPFTSVPPTSRDDVEGEPASRRPAGVRRLLGLAAPLAVTLSFVALHLALIGADSPPRLGIVPLDSGAFIDEGYKNYDVRNRYLFGSVRLHPADEYAGNWTEGSPINTWLTRAVVAVAGLDLGVLRTVNLAFAVACAVLFWSVLRGRFGATAAFWGLVLLLAHPLFNVYARLALLEAKLLFFVMLAFFALPPRPRADWLTAARATLMVAALLGAYFTKPTALVFVGAAALGLGAWACCTFLRRPPLLRLGAAGAVVLAIGAAAAIQLRCTDPGACEFLYTRALDSPIAAVPDALVADSFLLNPALGALALLGAALVLRRALAADPGPPHDLLAVSWLLVPTFFFAMLTYQPDRYFLLPVPALVWLSILPLVELRSLAAFLFPGRPGVWSVATLALCSFLAAIHFAPTLLADVQIGSDPGLVPRALAEAPHGPWVAGLGLVAAIVISISAKAAPGLVRRLVRPALVTLLVAGTGLGLAPLVSWVAAPPYQLLPAAERLESLGERTVLAGDWAPQLGLPSRIRTIYSNWNAGMNHAVNLDNLDELGVTHVAIAEGINDGYRDRLDQLYPGARAETPTLRIEYGGREISIYEFEPGDVSRR